MRSPIFSKMVMWCGLVSVALAACADGTIKDNRPAMIRYAKPVFWPKDWPCGCASGPLRPPPGGVSGEVERESSDNAPRDWLVVGSTQSGWSQSILGS